MNDSCDFSSFFWVKQIGVSRPGEKIEFDNVEEILESFEEKFCSIEDLYNVSLDYIVDRKK